MPREIVSGPARHARERDLHKFAMLGTVRR
jgi:hypothetical protein